MKNSRSRRSSASGLESLPGRPVGPGAEFRQIVALDLALALQAEVEQRLVSDDLDVVGKAAEALQQAGAVRGVLAGQFVDQAGDQFRVGVHDVREALVRVDVGQQQRALGDHSGQVPHLEFVHHPVGQQLARGLAQALFEGLGVQSLDTSGLVRLSPSWAVLLRHA